MSYEEEELYDVFNELLQEREHLVFPLGMSGSLMLRQISPPHRILKAGKKLGYEGDDLDDFAIIMRRIEDDAFELNFKAQMDVAIKAIEAAARRR